MEVYLYVTVILKYCLVCLPKTIFINDFYLFAILVIKHDEKISVITRVMDKIVVKINEIL